MNKNDLKEAVKEAHKEWLESKFAEFGRWSLGAIAVLIFGALMYFVLWITGWHNESVPSPGTDSHVKPFTGKKLEG